MEELKKNDKVIVRLIDRECAGTVIGNPFRLVSDKELYVEVYIHDMDLEIPVKLKCLSKI